MSLCRWFYNIVFSYGIGPLSWVYPVEVLPNHLRATGTTITTMASWYDLILLPTKNFGALRVVS